LANAHSVAFINIIQKYVDFTIVHPSNVFQVVEVMHLWSWFDAAADDAGFTERWGTLSSCIEKTGSVFTIKFWSI